MTDLHTTNILLGILAAVSLLEGLAVVGIFVAGFLLYRQIKRVIDGIEARQIAPVTARVNAILDDVKEMSSVVKDETQRAGRSVRWVFDWLQRKRDAHR